MNASVGNKELEKVIKHVGSQQALATLIGYSQQAVSLWLTTPMKVPGDAALLIQNKFPNVTNVQKLRPDLFKTN